MRTTRSSWTVLVVLTCLATWAPTRQAVAQSDAPAALACMPPTWYAALPASGDVMVGVPFEGALVFPAWLQTMEGEVSPEAALAYVTVQVTDAADADVAGTLRYDAGFQAIVWQADTPLAPSATYSCGVHIDNLELGNQGYCGGFGEVIDRVFRFTTAAEALQPLNPPAVDSSGRLTQYGQGIVACCPVVDDPTMCMDPRGGCDMCWNDGYTYLPMMEFGWTPTVEAGQEGYVAFEVQKRVDDGAFAFDTSLGLGAEAATLLTRFDAAATTYCVRVVGKRVSDGAQASSEELCLGHDTLETIDAIAINRPDLSQCKGPVEGGLGEDSTTSEEDCGCAIRRQQTPSRAGWLMLAGLGCLLLARRRRR